MVPASSSTTCALDPERSHPRATESDLIGCLTRLQTTAGEVDPKVVDDSIGVCRAGRGGYPESHKTGVRSMVLSARQDAKEWQFSRLRHVTRKDVADGRRAGSCHGDWGDSRRRLVTLLSAVSDIHWEGMHYRRDIAARPTRRRRQCLTFRTFPTVLRPLPCVLFGAILAPKSAVFATVRVADSYKSEALCRNPRRARV